MAKPNLAIEQAVLAGIFRHGRDAFVDVQDTIDSACFSDSSNGIIFRCLERMFENEETSKVDIPSVIGAASLLNLDALVGNDKNLEKMRGLLSLLDSRK